MNYLSVCSGIEAATVAWEPLGWRPLAFSEIEPFPVRLLAHRYPHVPNLGTMEGYAAWTLQPDILVGGTPCQAFSIAGLRAGLSDPRGNLALVYLAIAQRLRPRWLVWENVPGVLSSNGGRDFGTFLHGLAEIGFGFAYRILDPSDFGMPVRRPRVFVVGHFGSRQKAAAVLFDSEGLPRTAGEAFEDGPADTGTAKPGPENERCSQFAFSITPEGGQGANLTAVQVEMLSGISAVTLGAQTDRGIRIVEQCAPGQWTVRRLTPTEYERALGFPDGWTEIEMPACQPRQQQLPGIEPAPARLAVDLDRYRALGNSMAVPVVQWIGQRIAHVDALPASSTR